MLGLLHWGLHGCLQSSVVSYDCIFETQLFDSFLIMSGAQRIVLADCSQQLRAEGVELSLQTVSCPKLERPVVSVADQNFPKGWKALVSERGFSVEHSFEYLVEESS